MQCAWDFRIMSTDKKFSCDSLYQGGFRVIPPVLVFFLFLKIHSGQKTVSAVVILHPLNNNLKYEDESEE